MVDIPGDLTDGSLIVQFKPFAIDPELHSIPDGEIAYSGFYLDAYEPNGNLIVTDMSFSAPINLTTPLGGADPSSAYLARWDPDAGEGGAWVAATSMVDEGELMAELDEPGRYAKLAGLPDALDLDYGATEIKIPFESGVGTFSLTPTLMLDGAPWVANEDIFIYVETDFGTPSLGSYEVGAGESSPGEITVESRVAGSATVTATAVYYPTGDPHDAEELVETVEIEFLHAAGSQTRDVPFEPGTPQTGVDLGSIGTVEVPGELMDSPLILQFKPLTLNLEQHSIPDGKMAYGGFYLDAYEPNGNLIVTDMSFSAPMSLTSPLGGADPASAFLVRWDPDAGEGGAWVAVSSMVEGENLVAGLTEPGMYAKLADSSGFPDALDLDYGATDIEIPFESGVGTFSLTPTLMSGGSPFTATSSIFIYVETDFGTPPLGSYEVKAGNSSPGEIAVESRVAGSAAVTATAVYYPTGDPRDAEELVETVEIEFLHAAGSQTVDIWFTPGEARTGVDVGDIGTVEVPGDLTDSSLILQFKPFAIDPELHSIPDGKMASGGFYLDAYEPNGNLIVTDMSFSAPMSLTTPLGGADPSSASLVRWDPDAGEGGAWVAVSSMVEGENLVAGLTEPGMYAKLADEGTPAEFPDEVVVTASPADVTITGEKAEANLTIQLKANGQNWSPPEGSFLTVETTFGDIRSLEYTVPIDSSGQATTAVEAWVSGTAVVTATYSTREADISGSTTVHFTRAASSDYKEAFITAASGATLPMGDANNTSFTIPAGIFSEEVFVRIGPLDIPNPIEAIRADISEDGANLNLVGSVLEIVFFDQNGKVITFGDPPFTSFASDIQVEWNAEDVDDAFVVYLDQSGDGEWKKVASTFTPTVAGLQASGTVRSEALDEPGVYARVTVGGTSGGNVVYLPLVQR
ncbi:MAG: hypothetical protein HC884_06080 [Chloroflexaceae bacterium]|nr:hypothetical protein [Chloroflexaceae bacterium]